MLRLPVALALLALSVSACAREAAPPAAPAAAAESSAATPAAEPSAPTAQISESQEATASQESGGEANTEEHGDVTLERLAALPSAQQLPSGKWKAGVNYMPLVPAIPTSVAADKVEVVEVFWYGCPHCNALEPFITSWLKNKADYIEFVRMPVMWGPVHRAHARLFYVLKALGRLDLHQKVFDTIHKDGRMLVSNDEQTTRKMQLDFATANGIKAEDFNKAWDSFTVSSDLQRAEQLTERYQVAGVPLIIINGKYTTDVGQAGGNAGELLSLINDLAASEKRR
jgi:protein dithiol oxidoreductase (disulfide-forming)